MSIERRKVMQALGAKLILTEAAKGMQGAVDAAAAYAAENAATRLMLQQFQNPPTPPFMNKPQALKFGATPTAPWMSS